ncbi:hypothetical protein H5P28_12085 [Ruficoccus amylovorans]|uniref:histidine kinase n=1 Tax=Ruficoccus amylovorans TaxID=1804625 RepID=A0A842HHH3_9BACT|nr:ATP-binding protein [Ruficoccus amylovorans]MBC2594997.1 hypothetical protein [Ruficoccus amylovorans]
MNHPDNSLRLACYAGNSTPAGPFLHGTGQSNPVLHCEPQILHFSVQPDWCIINHCAEAYVLDPDGPANLNGRSLRELLVKLDPELESVLPRIAGKGCRCTQTGEDRAPVFDKWSLSCFSSSAEPGAPVFVRIVGCVAPSDRAMSSPSDFVPRPAWSGGEASSPVREQHHEYLQLQGEMSVGSRGLKSSKELPGVHFIQDPHLDFEVINPDLRNFLSAEAAALLKDGADWLSWIDPRDLPTFEAALADCQNSATSVSVRYRIKLPGEERSRHVLEMRHPLYDDSGKMEGYDCAWLDMTAHERERQQLFQFAWRQDMADISTTLAHDFHNLLSGIGALSQLLMDSEPQHSERREDFQVIRHAIDEAQHLSDRLMALNRDSSGQKRLQDLIGLVRDQERLMRAVLPKQAQLHVELPEAEYPVMIDSISFRRVLLNLISNARDALKKEDGFPSTDGRVTLELRHVELENYTRDHLISSRVPRRGRAAELSVRDNGCGIPAEILKRVFEPYFTTKQHSGGTGLGLYSLVQFAEENGIDFGVRSTPSSGTTIFLLIPFNEAEDGAVIEEANSRAGQSVPGQSAPVPHIGIYSLVPEEQFAPTPLGTAVDRLDSFDQLEAWLAHDADQERLLLIVSDMEHPVPSQLRDLLRNTPNSTRRMVLLKGAHDLLEDRSGRNAPVVLGDHSPLIERMYHCATHDPACRLNCLKHHLSHEAHCPYHTCPYRLVHAAGEQLHQSPA